MQDDTTGSAQGTPWHLWVIGIVALLWDAFGAFDYVMTMTENADYLGQFTPEQQEFFSGFPAWLVAFWAVAVWGGVLGSVLLLLRKRLAVQVFMTSFAAMTVTAFHNFVLSNGLEVVGGVGAAFSAVIFAVALGLWLYSRAMADRGVLA